MSKRQRTLMIKAIHSINDFLGQTRIHLEPLDSDQAEAQLHLLETAGKYMRLAERYPIEVK